ncbi:unnamed protein product [Gongylonema pulchrum]|uniref:Sulfhydryl oxidase n=1 Tax=Gongylonema pulchrum TaxID=637853 RepID=A0A183DW72_9BILA|nr:unnamed protein product [Gongylonema pulchrum]
MDFNLQEAYGNPFPTQADWEHCAGSNPQFRGYTCGLWTTFHALTVQAYKKALSDPKFDPTAPLAAIRNWVDYFFGCRHCRGHFLNMTTRTFRMESHVSEAILAFCQAGTTEQSSVVKYPLAR